LLTALARSGLSRITNLSLEQKTNAKTVTSFLIILSVLEVSCAIQCPGIRLKKKASRRVGEAGWLDFGASR